MKKKPSKISAALAYLKAHPEASQYAAAKHAGISASQLYRNLKAKKAKEQGVCPGCGQRLPYSIIPFLEPDK